MKKRIAFVAGLLAVSTALIFVSAPEAKACEGGGGDKKIVMMECVCYNENGELVVVGHYNDCESGNRFCVPTNCSFD